MNKNATREDILKMIKGHAEEPDDISDGEGTFTTFRVEYLINDIMQLINKEKQAVLEDKWVDINDEVSGRWYCVDFTQEGKEGVQMFEKEMWRFHKPHEALKKDI